MSSASQPDTLLVERIRAGEPAAWNDLINRFEGRLLAFVESRLRHRAASEDVVQETFIGFLTSIPNYDPARPLEGYLFSIAAHKLTDHLRREGRRPALPLAGNSTGGGEWELPGSQRPASSIARSGERKALESAALVEAIAGLMRRWKQQGDWEKIKCAELLFVRGLPNKEAAKQLGISEQAVANYKFDFLARLRSLVKQSGLPSDVFPELQEK
ncbi:MAG TPA: sigma-70 family RNA polymerase sigma factor [Pirellulales bacterium]|nr:sigma-70 family RNA polymerase sigma factor [Pirellulales bacterium]